MAKRCVRGCGAVDCWDGEVSARVLEEEEEADAVARRSESIWLSMASWKRGQSSMLVPLM